MTTRSAPIRKRPSSASWKLTEAHQALGIEGADEAYNLLVDAIDKPLPPCRSPSTFTASKEVA